MKVSNKEMIWIDLQGGLKTHLLGLVDSAPKLDDYDKFNIKEYIELYSKYKLNNHIQIYGEWLNIIDCVKLHIEYPLSGIGEEVLQALNHPYHSIWEDTLVTPKGQIKMAMKIVEYFTVPESKPKNLFADFF